MNIKCDSHLNLDNKLRHVNTMYEFVRSMIISMDEINDVKDIWYINERWKEGKNSYI